MTVSPDTEITVAFLDAWTPGGPWTLTAIQPDGDNVIETRTFHEAEATRRWIDGWQGRRNLYFSVNQPKRDLRKKAAKADIGALVAFHVDLDAPAGVDPAIAKAEDLLPKLRAHVPPPSVIVDSGGGVQGFWLLSEPVLLNGPDSVPPLEAYNRGLEAVLGGDHCHNIDRIMRLPGTINLPDARKRAKGREAYVATLVEADWDLRYDLADFQPAPDIFTAKSKKPNGAADAPAESGEELDELLARLPKWVITRLKDPAAANRSDALASLYRALFKLDLDDAAIERIIRAHPGGIGSKFAGRNDLDADIARFRAKTAASRKAKGKPSQFDDAVSDEAVAAEQARTRKQLDDHIADFNRQFAVVNEAGKVWIFQWRADPAMKREVLERLSFTDFRHLYENRHLEVITVDRPPKAIRKTLAEWWITHHERRQYPGGVTFDPTDRAPPGYWNLWCGFAVEPVPGDWSLLRSHIENVICGGVAEHAAYVTNWMARAVQNPDTQGEVALVMRGDKGVGKGILGRYFCALFGQHGMQINNSIQFVGRFNAHLRDLIALFADEAFYAGDKQHEGVLKGLITEPNIVIEGKYQNAVVVPNRLHVIMASNSDWVVPASSDERRYAVFNVLDSRRGNRAYFSALVNQMENGGLAAMLHDLRTRDISDFEVRDPPQTDALRAQKTLSLGSLERWWIACLGRGFIWKSRFGAPYFRAWQDLYSIELMNRSYQQWCEENRPFDRKSRGQLGVFMGKLCETSRPRASYPLYELESVDTEIIRAGQDLDQASIVWGNRPQMYQVGELAEARDRFKEVHDIAVTEWDEPDHPIIMKLFVDTDDFFAATITPVAPRSKQLLD